MNTIRILTEKVASQIAAGEVIDRPASVVRELIDNSIDAGANRIAVKIERGGKGLIKVVDNGAGMSRDDLLLSVERHATSKIESASDLFSVATFGFRGEALPSMASVSRMNIVSRPSEQMAGHILKIAGGKLVAIEETGAPPGTIVELRDLFFNVPARRKFLRAARTETGHILDVMWRAALPFPGTTFKLEDSGKNLMNLTASDQQLPRLAALMGRKTVESATEIQESNDVLSIRAYLSSPDFARSRADRLFVYVNGRNVRDRMVTRAVMEGYGQRLMRGRYPQAVIFIEIDPSQVDVNVHPTKQEVRFRESQMAYRTIVSSVEKALIKSFHAFFGPLPGREVSTFSAEKFSGTVSEPVREYSSYKWIESAQPGIQEGPQIIGQLGNTYILCQIKDGLFMLDQHAAHERVVYENLKKALHDSRIEIQNLLVPFELELTMNEKRIALEKGDQLSRFGLDLEHFGGNTFLLRSHPLLLKSVDWNSFLPEVIAVLGEGVFDDNILLDKVLTVMACHGAVRAGKHMTHDEMSYLLKQLEEMDLPTNCPHGRPIFRHLTYHEIEKMFRRVV